MWFKSLALQRFTEPFTQSPEELAEALARAPFRPCGGQDLSSRGWIAPIGGEGAPLAHAAGGYVLVCLQTEDKLLPASVIRDVLDERVQELEEREARKLGRREKAELKDAVIQELLPRAFVRRRRAYAYLDPRGGWLVLSVTSPRQVDDFTGTLRKTLGTLPLAPLRVAVAPSAVMTGWLRGEGLAAGFVLEDECELRDGGEEGGVVRCKGQDLAGEEIATHLAAGKQVTRLAVQWNERLACVLGDDLAVRRLRFLDVVQEQLEDTRAESLAEELDARFALMTGELARFLPALVEAFGGEAPRT